MDHIEHLEETIEIDQLIPASAEEVWAALTTDDGLAAWMGKGSSVEEQVDGEVRFSDPASGRPRRGVVEHLESERELSFVWWPEDDPDFVSQVSIILEPSGADTRLRVIESAPVALQASLHAPQALCSQALCSQALVSQALWSWRAAMVMVCRAPVCA